MNGSDELVLVGLGGKEGVLIEKLDVIDGQFKVSGIVGGQCSQQIELCKFS
jgi:hypothetical protein